LIIIVLTNLGRDLRLKIKRLIVSLRNVVRVDLRGRPTNFKVLTNKELSLSSRVIQQRNLAALRTKEEETIVKAKSSNRQAKLKLKRKIKDNTKYQALPTKKAKSIFIET
jgi:hypothetical protein